MKVYLSGPITGVPDFEKNFARAVQYVKDWNIYHWHEPNLEVVNPVLTGKETEKKYVNPTWQLYMKDCLREMLTCDFIIMLPFWQMSKGALEEKRIAEMLDMEVMYMSNNGEIK